MFAYLIDEATDRLLEARRVSLPPFLDRYISHRFQSILFATEYLTHSAPDAGHFAVKGYRPAFRLLTRASRGERKFSVFGF